MPAAERPTTVAARRRRPPDRVEVAESWVLANTWWIVGVGAFAVAVVLIIASTA